MKRFLICILIASLLLTILVSCNKDGDNGNVSDESTTAPEESTPQGNGETNGNTDGENDGKSEDSKGDESGIPQSTEGLAFELNPDGKGYTLVGIGTCKNTRIVVGTYKGLPVTRIKEGAFEVWDNSSSIKNLTICECVAEIGNRAFMNCESIDAITISNGVVSIGDEAFSQCTAIQYITVPESVTSIGERAFENMWELRSITVSESNTAYKSEGGVLYSKDGSVLILYPQGKLASTFEVPDGVTKIENDAFASCNIKKIILPDGILSVGDFAFSSTFIEEISIPAGVETVGNSVFWSCIGLKTVNFGGDSEEWNALFDESAWDDAGDFTVHCSDKDIEIKAPEITE